MARYDLGRKFVDYTGSTVNTRSRASVQNVPSIDAVSRPQELLRAFTNILKRLAGLEANKTPDYIDFERNLALGASGTVELVHNFNSPVRFWIVYMAKNSVTGVIPTTYPLFYVNSSSDNNKLVLSLGTGLGSFGARVIFRVEKAQLGSRIS